ncbi:Hypothetical predicted protein [Cloeon dipterum]|uniref:glutathione transferase n=1 Tax=Cloeon dipterum TaxID=197152 RepID=A0A8S1CWP1_9INSE|nr:Hypothetical predicted protein [Cloeon dipterum]
MSATKLTYLALPGLAEGIRYLLHYGGVQFEDERLTREEVAAMKEKLPLGQVPVLQIEGKTLFQSQAICRFLAKRFNLTGKDEWDSVQCDIASDTIYEIRNAYLTFFHEKNEAAQKEKRVAAVKKIDFILGKLEGHLAKNDGHFVKGQLTWPDFMIAAFAEHINSRAGQDMFAAKPLLSALRDEINALPAIKAYIEKRPKY